MLLRVFERLEVGWLFARRLATFFFVVQGLPYYIDGLKGMVFGRNPYHKEVKMRVRMVFGLLPVLLCIALSCGGDGTIASGGDFVLRVDDLRYELSKLGPSSNYEDTLEGKLAVVEKLAARSYLADEAERLGYGGDDLEHAIAKAEAEAVAAAYRTAKIDNRVMTPRIQRKPWIEKLDRKLYLKELVFAVYPVAEEALEELKQGGNFDDLAAESEGREDVRMNDLGWAVWKDLNRDIANVVFRLGVGEASHIVAASDGYHIFYLVDEEQFGLGMELLSLRSRRFLTELEKERLVRLETEEITNRYDVRFRDEGITAAMKAFASSFRGERPDDALIDELLATYSDGRILVAGLFNAYYSMPLESRPYVGDDHGLREFAIQILMPRLEALAGYDMGLDRSVEVAWAAKTAREEYLVPMMEDHFRSQIEISEQEIASYYAERRKDMRVPARYRFRRIVVSSREKAGNVRRQLTAGRDFAQVAAEMSEDEYTAPKGGDTGWLTAGMVAVYDSVAEDMRPGEITDPFATRSGIEILKLEEREDGRELTYEEAVPRIRTYITNIRVNELLDEWVTEKKRELGFTVDRALLERVRLPVPEYMQQRAGVSSEDEELPSLPKMD